jgi:hypothetical protein
LCFFALRATTSLKIQSAFIRVEFSYRLDPKETLSPVNQHASSVLRLSVTRYWFDVGIPRPDRIEAPDHIVLAFNELCHNDVVGDEVEAK